MRFMAFVSVLLCTAVFAADSLVEKWQKRIDSADAAYSAAVKKADDTRFYAVQKANGDRLTVLKKALTDATKAGDFDAATTLKGLVAAAEKDGISRPKPKNTVKFGGHEYALIEEKVTWHIAKRMCEEMGGHLATLETSGEMNIVKQLTGSQTIWLGATDEQEDDVYIWVTGAPCDLTIATLDRENHGAVDVWCFEGSTSLVIDWHSGDRLPFICEIDR